MCWFAVCPAGKSQPKRGQTTCNKCAAGLFQDDPAATECDKCPPGLFQNQGGETDCKGYVPVTLVIATTTAASAPALAPPPLRCLAECGQCEMSLEGSKFCWECEVKFWLELTAGTIPCKFYVTMCLLFAPTL